MNEGDTKSIEMKKQECIVYLESLVVFEKGVVDVLIDFRLQEDMRIYNNYTHNKLEKATYLSIHSLKTSKRLLQGCYYKLNLQLLGRYQFTQVQDSAIIGGSYNLALMSEPNGDGEEVLQSHGPLDKQEPRIDATHKIQLPNSFCSKNLKLFVKDVGQANWNELRSEEEVLLAYDLGAETNATKKHVLSIFNSRRAAYVQTKPVLIISHWDVDHYHCLRVLSTKDIQDCFSAIICPNVLKTLTSQNVFNDCLNALGTSRVYCLPPPPKTKGSSMHPCYSSGCVSFYQGEHSSRINLCGIVMFVKGSKRSANYTGDCRLTQADNVYNQEASRGLQTVGHVLIAPHHGGDYGHTFRSYSRPCDYVAISVGVNNRNGHPHKDMLRYLQSLGTVKQTKFVGDIIEDL